MFMLPGIGNFQQILMRICDLEKAPEPSVCWEKHRIGIKEPEPFCSRISGKSWSPWHLSFTIWTRRKVFSFFTHWDYCEIKGDNRTWKCLGSGWYHAKWGVILLIFHGRSWWRRYKRRQRERGRMDEASFSVITERISSLSYRLCVLNSPKPWGCCWWTPAHPGVRNESPEEEQGTSCEWQTQSRTHTQGKAHLWAERVNLLNK